MTDAKHTPGPWTVDPTRDIGPCAVGTEISPIANTDSGGMNSPEEDEANARLIAAAPAMFEECRLAEVAARAGMAGVDVGALDIATLRRTLHAIETCMGRALEAARGEKS